MTDSWGFSYETQKGADLEYTSVRDATDHEFARVVSADVDFPNVGSYLIEIDLGDSGIYDVAQEVPQDLDYDKKILLGSERRRSILRKLKSGDKYSDTRFYRMDEDGLKRHGNVDDWIPDIAEDLPSRNDLPDRTISGETVKTAEWDRNEEWIRFSNIGSGRKPSYALLSGSTYRASVAATLASRLNPPMARKCKREDSLKDDGLVPDLEEAGEETLGKVFNQALEQQSSTDLSEPDVGSDLQDTSRS